MQTKDIPDLPVLLFLLRLHPRRCFTFGVDSIEGAFAPDTPPKLILSKMASLIRRGLVEGCTCGCRGDFELTEEGLAIALVINQEKPCTPPATSESPSSTTGTTPGT